MKKRKKSISKAIKLIFIILGILASGLIVYILWKNNQKKLDQTKKGQKTMEFNPEPMPEAPEPTPSDPQEIQAYPRWFPVASIFVFLLITSVGVLVALCSVFGYFLTSQILDLEQTAVAYQATGLANDQIILSKLATAEAQRVTFANQIQEILDGQWSEAEKLEAINQAIVALGYPLQDSNMDTLAYSSDIAAVNDSVDALSGQIAEGDSNLIEKITSILASQEDTAKKLETIQALIETLPQDVVNAMPTPIPTATQTLTPTPMPAAP